MLEASEERKEPDSFVAKVEMRLDKARAEIDRLAAKARKGAADIEGRVRDLSKQETTVREQLDEIKRTSAAGGREVRRDIERGTERLSEEVREIKTKAR